MPEPVLRLPRQARRPALLALGLLAVSLLPLSLKNALGTTGRLHSVGHVAAFAILMVAGFAPPYATRDILIGTPLVMLLAVFIEALEAIIYSGSFELRDVRSDFEGVLLGLLIVAAFVFRAEAKLKRNVASQNT